jgi:hypothetical protein
MGVTRFLKKIRQEFFEDVVGIFLDLVIAKPVEAKKKDKDKAICRYIFQSKI